MNCLLRSLWQPKNSLPATCPKYIEILTDKIPFQRGILRSQKLTANSLAGKTLAVSGAPSLTRTLPVQVPLDGPYLEPTGMVSITYLLPATDFIVPHLWLSCTRWPPPGPKYRCDYWNPFKTYTSKQFSQSVSPVVTSLNFLSKLFTSQICYSSVRD